MKRDLQIDAIRGVCLVLMMIAHVGGPISKLTLEFMGFMGAPEGFVFLSGMIAGLVYTRRSDTHSQSTLQHAAIGRASTLYRYHVGIYLLILAITVTLPTIAQPWQDGYAKLFFLDPGLALLLGPLFLYQPLFIGLLPMYVWFILLTPVVLQQFKRGREKTVLVTSFAVWLACQFGWHEWLLELTIGRIVDPLLRFSPLAWQLMYCLGLWVGFRKHRGQPLFRDWDTVLLRLCSVVALACFVVRHGLRLIKRVERTGSSLLDSIADHLPSPEFIALIDDNLAYKLDLGPLRLLNFFAVVYIASFVLARYRPLLRAKWLAFIGQHSLEVYAFHVLVVYGFVLLEGNLLQPPSATTAIIKAIYTLLAVASLTIPAIAHQRYRKARALAAAGGPPAPLKGPSGPGT